MRREIVETGDGSKTLYIPEIDETYHSTFGAINESLHVFINNGIELIDKKQLNVFEVGFGTGLNAFLTALYCKEKKIYVRYYCIEKYPISNQLVSELNFTNKDNEEVFNDIHKAGWGRGYEISPYFYLQKNEADIQKDQIKLREGIDLIYFDAFAPSKQPEMWTELVFQKMLEILLPDGILVTYSAAGVVKKALRNVGFQVKRLKGPVGKHHMLIAKKNLV